MQQISDQALIERGAEIAGSQNQLAKAVGYSARVISNAKHGTPLPPDARDRIETYVRTKKPLVDGTVRVIGRKPALRPARGIVTIALTPKEWERVKKALGGATLRAWFSAAIRGYLKAQAELPVPEDLPADVERRRQRLDADAIEDLTKSLPIVETRPHYLRLAALAAL